MFADYLPVELPNTKPLIIDEQQPYEQQQHDVVVSKGCCMSAGVEIILEKHLRTCSGMKLMIHIFIINQSANYFLDWLFKKLITDSKVTPWKCIFWTEQQSNI